MQMVRQDDDGLDVERMAPPNIAERLAQEIDVINKKTQAALSQIGREEKAAATDEVSPIVGHRVSIAQRKVIAAARRWVSLRSTHPRGLLGASEAGRPFQLRYRATEFCIEGCIAFRRVDVRIKIEEA
jgi:hypothetical protein